MWKERALLWPRQPQQYSWNGDLGQRSEDSVTVFNMCPTCYSLGTHEQSDTLGFEYVCRFHCHENV